MSEFPSRNLFSNPTSPFIEPITCKKIIVDTTFTPNFGVTTKQPIIVSHVSNFIDKKSIASRIQLNFPQVQQQELKDDDTPHTPTYRKQSDDNRMTGEKKPFSQKYNPNNSKIVKSLNSLEETQKYQSRFNDQYRILKILGSGYFGTVYKCQEQYSNQIYAIKCTKIIQKWSKDIINESKQLAFLTNQGKCQNVIRYFNSWQENNANYLLMEYCDSNVSQRIDYAEFEIKKILKDITNGLLFLHSNNVSHLDIKPDNILYNQKERQYKLADLGLARQMKHNLGEVLEGDSRFMAKELLNQKEGLDLTKADIFSLGATIYHLVIKQELPKNGNEWHKIREGLIYEDFKGQLVSQRLKSLIIRMMHPDPNQRLSAKEILFDEYIFIKKENYIKWEKIRGLLLRKQLDVIKQQKRKLSV